jgi:hypothetical protein
VSHGACGAGGYQTLRADRSHRAASVVAGSTHVLQARLDGATLRVLADGSVAWEGSVPADVAHLPGPAGLRSDNARLEVELVIPDVTAGSAAAVPLAAGAQ